MPKHYTTFRSLAHGAAPIAAGQQRRYLSGSKTPWQGGAAPPRRGRNRTRQRHDDRALEKRKTQERPQPGGQALH